VNKLDNLKPFEKGNNFGKGRPKGKRNRSTMARLLLEAKLDIDTFPMAEQHRESIKAIMRAFGFDPEMNQSEMFMSINQFMQGLKDDPKSKAGYDALMDSGYGKPAQPIEMVEPERETHDLSKLTEDELNEYITLENRIKELLSKCAIEDAPSPEITG